MSKNQADAAKQGEFDAMGQPINAKKGEADPKAMRLIQEAKARAKELPGLDEDEDELTPLVTAPTVPKAPEAPNIGSGMLEALKAEMENNPEAAREIFAEFTKDNEIRDLLRLQAGQAGNADPYDYVRHYTRERALDVPGGQEVNMGPSFMQLMGSWGNMYFDHETGQPTNAASRAKLDHKGRKVLTEEYKHFLDVRRKGGHMASNVRHDIAAGAFGAGVEMAGGAPDDSE